MKQGLYFVYDRKIGGFSMPFMAQTDLAATRSFTDALRQEGSMLQRHPEDFTLCKLAYLFDESGVVESLSQPELVYDGQRFVTDKEVSNVR